jgi:cell division protein FtsI (penicillin-binding protein 3)/stage V sporulation protein D (sporulation-specific penicillin-binding protein)
MEPPAASLTFKPLQYRRLVMIVFLLLAALGWMFTHLYSIQVLRHRELLSQAQKFSHTTRTLVPHRGEIRDRNGVVLAISNPVKEVYINLQLCSNRVERVAQTAGALLGITPERLASKVHHALRENSKTGAAPQKALLLQKDFPGEDWALVEEKLKTAMFGIPGPATNASATAELSTLRKRLLFARDRQHRIHPWGQSLCQVVGFVGAGTNGIGLLGLRGIERACDDLLAGESGLCVSRQDAAGNELPAYRRLFEPPTDGAHVYLTIDLRVQQIVEQALAAAHTNYRARSVSAMVMDPATGEILALACYPGFDPQKPGGSEADTWRNRVLLDMVEPGSILKFITLACALEQRAATLDTTVDCEKGRFVVNKVPVKDHGSHGLLSVRQSFAKSSNIAFAKLGLGLGAHRLYQSFTNFGLAHPTGIAFANEAPGRIALPHSWSTMTLTRAAFGQGLSVSQLQMAAAMSAIANEGRLMRPWLVSRIESPQGQVLRQFGPRFVRSAVSPGTARQVKEALKTVVSPGGTGALAALNDYTVAAKTGTAQIANSRGYQPGAYYSSMLGFFPANSPRVVISVALDEPRNGYYAGTVAAPVFRVIAEKIAVCLQIPPDKIDGMAETAPVLADNSTR